MTVTVTYAPVQSPGAGTAAPIPIPWEFEIAELAVVERDDTTGADTAKTITTHYTVQRNVGAPGGSVTPVASRPAGKTWIISRATTPLQTSTLRLGGSFSEETVEAMFDRQARLAQELVLAMSRALAGTPPYVGTDWDFAAGGRRITGLGDAVDNADAVNLKTLLAYLDPPQLVHVLGADYLEPNTGTAFVAVPDLSASLTAGKRYRIRFLGAVSPAANPPFVASPTGVDVGVLSSDGLAGVVNGVIRITSPSGGLVSGTVDSLDGATGNFKRSTGAMTALSSRHMVTIDAAIECTASGRIRIGVGAIDSGDAAKMYAGAVLTVQELL